MITAILMGTMTVILPSVTSMNMSHLLDRHTLAPPPINFTFERVPFGNGRLMDVAFDGRTVHMEEEPPEQADFTGLGSCLFQLLPPIITSVWLWAMILSVILRKWHVLFLTAEWGALIIIGIWGFYIINGWFRRIR